MLSILIVVEKISLNYLMVVVLVTAETFLKWL